MYNIPHFKAADQEQVIAFMHAHPFIILCGADDQGKPVATHIPVLLETRGDQLFLLAHVMRKQEHTIAFEQNQQVLAIFYGPHTYVSASWYENKQIASTWNYQAVHVSGSIHFLDEQQLLAVLTRLTEKFEQDPASPSLVQKMDPAYLQKMLPAIIAFEIKVEKIEHVFKLSQNRDAASYHHIIDHLSKLDADAQAIAKTMDGSASQLFGQ